MAYPFFSGQIPNSSKSGEELVNEYEVYHNFILAYPAYTVDRIESELSRRQLNLLLDCWGKEPPTAMRIARIANMLEKKFGFKTISTKSNGSGSLVSKLEAGGWL